MTADPASSEPLSQRYMRAGVKRIKMKWSNIELGHDFCKAFWKWVEQTQLDYRTRNTTCNFGPFGAIEVTFRCPTK